MEELNDNLSTKAVYDYNLVRQAVDTGDQKAYAELMQRYKDSVFYMLLKMVNNKDDAEDLTIEAFGKAFKRLAQYTPTYAFSTWLFKIASNNAIDHLRKKKLRNNFSLDNQMKGDDGDSYSFELKADILDPEESVIKKQKIKQLRDVVDKLKPRYKDLIQYRYFEELSYEEISGKMDIPIGTVKAQLFRAREFLYEILKHTDSKN
jgi:RNA polymerase sigma factor (sigma-70 family)